jgi:hypothetical protein
VSVTSHKHNALMRAGSIPLKTGYVTAVTDVTTKKLRSSNAARTRSSSLPLKRLLFFFGDNGDSGDKHCFQALAVTSPSPCHQSVG